MPTSLKELLKKVSTAVRPASDRRRSPIFLSFFACLWRLQWARSYVFFTQSKSTPRPPYVHKTQADMGGGASKVTTLEDQEEMQLRLKRGQVIGAMQHRGGKPPL